MRGSSGGIIMLQGCLVQLCFAVIDRLALYRALGCIAVTWVAQTVRCVHGVSRFEGQGGKYRHWELP